MTDQQPEALRLADWLEADACDLIEPMKAAAELRRLHEFEVSAAGAIATQAESIALQLDRIVALEKALTQAVEALENSGVRWAEVEEASTTLRERLARQEPINPDPLHLSRILHELAGAASMCWTPRPSGVFDSEEAIKHVEAAIAEIRERLARQEQEPVAFINVEKRRLEWAKPMMWSTPTVVKLDRIPLYRKDT